MANISNILNKDIGIVTATEIASGVAVSFGAAHFLGETLPHPVEKIKDFIAKHVVEPHLETVFERYFRKLMHAEDLVQHQNNIPASEKPYKELSRPERVDKIAGIITRESAVFLAENGLVMALQYPLKKVFNAKIEPAKLAFLGAGVQLGAMAVSSTLLEKPTEWMFHKLADILPKVTSMNKKSAKDTARHLTYVALPGFLGFAAELVLAEREHAARR